MDRPPPPSSPPDEGDPLQSPAAKQILSRYWRSNVKVLIVLMTIWAVLGLGCGILFVEWLNQFNLGGYPLGFWFAQQGSIIGFVILILVYCLIMNWLDNKHLRELKELGITARPPSSSDDPSGGAH